MGRPPIVAADDWRQQGWRQLFDMPTPAPNTWGHHGGPGAVNTPSLSVLLGYERYHVESLGWRALAYSFAYGWPFVDGWATIYEGRGWGKQGGHTQGQNDVSHGHLFIGGWATGRVPDEMVRSLAWNIADGHRRGMCPLEITGGHRQAPGAQTSCPGSAGMDAIARARNLLPHILEEDDMPLTQDDLDLIVTAVWGGLPDGDNRWPDPSDGVHRNMATFARRTRVNEAMLKTLLKEVDELAAKTGIDVSALAAELGEQIDVDLSDLDLPSLTPGQVADEIQRRLVD